jgi:BirA family biotin operon repressor/biotin-[acetyl-CoA-carboxylase] ligase
VYSDLERPPLSDRTLTAAVRRDAGVWREVRVVGRTGSTNADLRAAAGGGEAEGLVLVADEQVGGRGRAGRSWVSPRAAGLTVSVLLRPEPVPPARWGWLPLLTGVALRAAVNRLAELETRLKWPNDLIVDVDGSEAKLAGILAESAAGAVVVGVGLNVTTRREELPEPHGSGLPATSLALAGAECTDRAPLLRALLREVGGAYARWRDAGGDPEASGVREAYLDGCATVGRTVRLHLPGGDHLVGDVVDVDGDGRLVVVSGDGTRTAVAAGDVVHVR